MKIIVLYALVIYFSPLNAQIISSEKIKTNVLEFLNDSTSDNYWQIIINNLKNDENSLTAYHYYLLYYMQGAKYQKIFPSLFIDPDRMKLKELVYKKRYEKAISLGEKLINENPVDIVTLIYLSHSIDKVSSDKENIYYQRMKKIVLSILSTGDGKMYQTAIKITNIGDDDEIIGFTGFKGISKSDKNINGKYYSVWRNKLGQEFYFEYVLLFK